MADEEPRYDEIVSREAVERLASRPDALGQLAMKMLGSTDEEEVFRSGVRAYISKTDQKKRRFAIAALAAAFEIDDRTALKRLLRYWGVVNERD